MVQSFEYIQMNVNAVVLKFLAEFNASSMQGSTIVVRIFVAGNSLKTSELAQYGERYWLVGTEKTNSSSGALGIRFPYFSS
jgi:hypothetical protein